MARVVIGYKAGAVYVRVLSPVGSGMTPGPVTITVHDELDRDRVAEEIWAAVSRPPGRGPMRMTR